MAIALRYAARTDLGLGPKARNEDSGYAGPHLLVLADGMGGHAAGDVASSMIVGRLAPLDNEALAGDKAMAALEEAVKGANGDLAQAMKDNPDLSGMGSTTIAMLRAGNKLAMAHIGDSRAYLLRDGVFSQITKDHSFVQQLLDEKRITAKEAINHPQRSIVTRVMTGRRDDEPDLSVRELRVGDRYLLCSDGLTDFVGPDIVHEILADSPDPGTAADRCIQVALKASTRDNVTVVVADVVDLDRDAAPSVLPQIVGAAAVRSRSQTRAMPTTPAEKANELRRTALGQPDADEDEAPPLAEETRSRRGRALRRVGVAAVLLVLVVGGVYAGYTWTQRQYFIGADEDRVAVFQGVNQTVGPVALSHLAFQTDIPLSSLPTVHQEAVRSTISMPNLDEAETRVGDLRVVAAECQAAKAQGGVCVPSLPLPWLTPGATTPPSPTPTPSATLLTTSPAAGTPGATPTPVEPLVGTVVAGGAGIDAADIEAAEIAARKTEP